MLSYTKKHYVDGELIKSSLFIKCPEKAWEETTGTFATLLKVSVSETGLADTVYGWGKHEV